MKVRKSRGKLRSINAGRMQKTRRSQRVDLRVVEKYRDYLKAKHKWKSITKRSYIVASLECKKNEEICEQKHLWWYNDRRLKRRSPRVASVMFNNMGENVVNLTGWFSSVATHMWANWKEGLRASITSFMVQCAKNEKEILGPGTNDDKTVRLLKEGLGAKQ